MAWPAAWEGCSWLSSEAGPAWPSVFVGLAQATCSPSDVTFPVPWVGGPVSWSYWLPEATTFHSAASIARPMPLSKHQARKGHQTYSADEWPREGASNPSWGKRVVVREGFLKKRGLS